MNDNDDWYTEGKAAVILEMCDELDLQEDVALSVYNWLEEFGLIDYDIEKELIYNYLYGDE